MQEHVTRGARRWASRGVDAMFAPSLEQGYTDRYRKVPQGQGGRCERERLRE